MEEFTKPLGGTELMYNELVKRLPKKYFDTFSIFNYPSQADPTKKMIYWNQLSYDQDAVQFLKEKQNIDKIDHFVFVSNWQAEKFRQIYGIPGDKTIVIQNAHSGVFIKDIQVRKKLKICYTSTPWRGLDVLLKAWEILSPEDCELYVYSSCKIYGKDFASEDKKYEFLYEWCQRLPNVYYKGSIPNEELREELNKFDILAYPNTFEETSCISVIEALATGLRVITSSIGALPETTEGWSRMYSYIDDREKHAEVFAKILGEEIQKMFNGELIDHLNLQKEAYSQRWSWDIRINEWVGLLDNIETKKSNFVFRGTWDAQIYDEVYNKNEYKIKYFKEDDVVIDIGSHIGSFTKLAIDKGSKNVHSYEADQDNYLLSVSNLSEYKANINNCGVWRSDDIIEDTIPFITNKENTGMHTTMSASESKNNILAVPLDNILSKFKKIRYLKIDVEGSEFPILLTSKLLNRVEEIVGEFHEYEGNKFKNLPDHCIVSGYGRYTRRELIYFLENKGFDVEIEEVNWSKSHGFFRAKNKNR